MKKSLALGVGAVLLLVIALVLLALIGPSAEPSAASRDDRPAATPPSSSSTGPAAASAAAPPTPAGHHATGSAAGSSRFDTDDPPPMDIVPIRRAYIQRENDTVPRDKDAPLPLFRKDTIQALRAAVTPEIKRCIDESFKRNPDTKPEDNASVMVIYTASATQGAVKLTKAQAVINGTQDDDALRCIEDAGPKVQFRGAADQTDGEGRVQLVFDYKR